MLKTKPQGSGIIFVLIIFMQFMSGCHPQTNKIHDNNSIKEGQTDPAAISGENEICQEFIKKLPSDYFYNWIEVPENYEHPEGSRTIQIFYYGKKGDFKEYLMFFNGGPGSDSHYNFTLFDSAFKKNGIENSDIGFIYMDQRGTGCSSNYPAVSETDPTQKQNDILQLRYYGSTGIVHDAEVIRKHLQNDKPWKIYGQSYGAHIVHRYVSIFPKSITSAYAHGNAITYDANQRMAERIYSQYSVLQMYLKKYPESRIKLRTLYNYLQDKKICYPISSGENYCGHQITELLISKVGFSHQWEKLSEILNYTVTVDKNKKAKVVTDNLKKYVSTVYEITRPNNGFKYAMRVLAMYDRNIIDADAVSCQYAYSYIHANYRITADEMMLNECLAEIQFNSMPKIWSEVKTALETLDKKKEFLLITEFTETLRQNNHLKFYLYSSEKDPYTPQGIFKEEVMYAGDLITYRHFMQSGHEGFYTESFILEELLKN